MAEEDEVDVLGDFSLDTLLSKDTNEISCCDNTLVPNNPEFLGFDDTLNSNWLLDNGVHPNTDVWYSSSSADFNTEDSTTNTSLGFDEVICSENKSFDDLEWTEQERKMLEKGLEIFGRSPVQLSQFVITKSPSQIKQYLNHVYFGNTSSDHSSNHALSSSIKSNSKTRTCSFSACDLIEDAQIPASIEEVIATVSTAKPTVRTVHKKDAKKTQQKYMNKFNFQQSLLKKRLCSSLRKKRYKKVNLLDKNKREKNITIAENDVRSNTHLSEAESNKQSGQSFPHRNITPVSSGEELIKIKKENIDSESDAEIEVDVDEIKSETYLNKKENLVTVENCEGAVSETVNCSQNEDALDSEKDLTQLSEHISENVLDLLKKTEEPTEECILEEETISDVEKFIHSEFFEGRSTKTPSRYLKIRNYIIDYWMSNRPSYCTKTSVRNGLKNCGDVNCIGRIHQYLEQIGAINFGCPQVQYIRPLLKMVVTNNVGVHLKDKMKKSHSAPVVQQRSDIVRARVRKKYNNDGEGGYTMVHNENGEVIDTTVVNEDRQSKPRVHRKNIRLVYCRSFTSDHPAPFSVRLGLEPLLMMDLHAHLAHVEVMGLLGGLYDPTVKILRILRYAPCRGLDHSNTHCDMCPVSQSEASEALQSENLEVVGWFHSHPTFYPNPSLQDIQTQLSMQQYLSNEHSPFVGLILSPFRSYTNTLVSEHRCLVVEKSADGQDEAAGVPYKFVTSLTSEGFTVGRLVKSVRNMMDIQSSIPAESVVDFSKQYFQDNTVTYLEKFLSSVKMHFARCGDINKMTYDAAIQALTDACIRQLKIGRHVSLPVEKYSEANDSISKILP